MTIVTGGYETDKKQEKGENKLLFYINLILAQLSPSLFYQMCAQCTILTYIIFNMNIYVLFLLFNFSLIDIIFHKCRQLISSIVHRGRHKKEKHKNLGNVPIRHDPPTHSDDSDIFSKSQPPWDQDISSSGQKFELPKKSNFCPHHQISQVSIKC